MSARYLAHFYELASLAVRGTFRRMTYLSAEEKKTLTTIIAMAMKQTNRADWAASEVERFFELRSQRPALESAQVKLRAACSANGGKASVANAGLTDEERHALGTWFTNNAS